MFAIKSFYFEGEERLRKNLPHTLGVQSNKNVKKLKTKFKIIKKFSNKTYVLFYGESESAIKNKAYHSKFQNYPSSNPRGVE